MSKQTTQKTWEITDTPSFAGKKVFVLQGAMYGLVVTMLARAGFERADNVKEADLVCFVGGTDVTPKFYGQEPIQEVMATDATRDLYEEAIYRQCLREKKPMFGICRGAQFLAVMCGAELWQHVNNHGSQHTIYDIEEDVVVPSSSMHHQMIKYNDEMTLLACCNEDVSTIFKDQNYFINKENQPGKDGYSHEIEVEACYYEKEKCLCIQGHPEIGPERFTSWSMHKLHDFMSKWESSAPTQNSVAETVLKQIG